ncbi:unnamed protein product [Chironomus riparius]|uniref:PDZ domain-containing protein n=1 Tax=Chironomus riparius TaxID=315576 RepID=A0A9N9WN33_9DIPT|nr:unnamed protein product [Chironomus riparius]
MRLGSSSINDPLIGVSNDYAELCDLETSSSTVSGLTSTTAGTKPRWAASSINNRRNVSAIYNQSVGSSSMTHIRNSYEAEDISTYDRARTIGNSTGSLCGLGGGGNSSSSVPTGASRYYSPPGTSYTIIERSHSPHYYYNAAGDPLAAAASKSRGGYYLDTLKQNGQKKRPISPERMFPITSSSSTPSSYHHLLPNGRNSPPVTSSSHQVYHRAARDRSMITRTVTMSRDQQPDGSHGFGICVKGGRETGIGVYISRVEEGSVAERSGLKPGDTILEVNGTPFSGMTHDEALTRCVQILKSSRQITMTVRGPTSLHGFGPPASATDVFKSSPMTGALLSPPSRQTCSWIDRHGRPASPPYDFEGRRSDRHERVRRVELVIEPGQSLGLMIRGGIEYGLGIYVTGVDKDSVADRAGLSVGDQILEVNGQSFMNVTHDEAVNQFKFHKRMSLVVRDVGKVPHSCTTIEPEPWDVGRRKCPVSAMVEEKARSLLPRHQFSNLSFYINEYGARGLTVDAFVSILLEMLDTPEKHTLVTEIRELIFPEDRPRYDELVYRRSKLSSRMDYYDSHRASDTDVEVSEVTKKKHVTMTDEKTSSRSGTPKMNASGTDIKNRYWFLEPPAPLPQGPSIHRHSSMRHLSSSQGHMSEMLAQAKKRFTPPPTFAKSSMNNASNFTYGNQFKQFSPLESKCGDKGSYLEGIRTQIGGITEKVKSWYWGRPLSMQRLPTEDSEANLDLRNHENLSHIVPDENGNLFITVRKTKAILGIAMEGGANTKHPLPRIINIHEHGAAYEAGGLEVGQLILEVDNTKVEGMQHQDVARLIAECYANRDRNEITFLVVEAKKSNLEPKPTALVFLEQ